MAAITRTTAGVRAGTAETVHNHGNTGGGLQVPEPGVATITRATLTAATVVLTFPAASPGKSFLLALSQDATGGRAVTWPPTVRWPYGQAPVLSPAATALDLFSFTCLDGTTWVGTPAGMDVR